MDPGIRACRRWVEHHARRAIASIYTGTRAPGERLLRRDRLIGTTPAAKAPRTAAR